MLAKKSENFMPTFRYNEFQKDQLMMICWLPLGGLDLHIYYYTDKSQKIQSFPESLEKRNNQSCFFVGKVRWRKC